ncbi:unnamed protein product [Sphenostylis stenocarpa]|uniref:Uncharacterized protein n=1 Tax=Sphenostylis stenocarpa TaxID=92480 RepID=A0AA86SD19_9FABA|nr:unnamed protein product [Sphenostylis stenocarpa]
MAIDPTSEASAICNVRRGTHNKSATEQTPMSLIQNKTGSNSKFETKLDPDGQSTLEDSNQRRRAKWWSILEAGKGRKNTTCPVTVLQDLNEAVRGQALKFTVRGGSSPGIFIDTPLDVAFVDKPACASSPKWVVVSDNFPGKWVGIGNANDHPGKQVIDGAFKIQKYSLIEGYKLVFCPTVAATRPCFNIGRREDRYGNRLILINETRSYFIFEVAFDKVN